MSSKTSHLHLLSIRFLDHIAISMAVVCAIHCLITPLLLIGLPILATTVWMDANFHLWMIILVIPTTTLAVWSGCRRHRDKWVIVLAALGLGLLSVSLASERMAQMSAQGSLTTAPQLSSASDNEPKDFSYLACNACVANSEQNGEILGNNTPPTWLSWHLILNLVGGLCLASAHARNYLLCRKVNCTHCDCKHYS